MTIVVAFSHWEEALAFSLDGQREIDRVFLIEDVHDGTIAPPYPAILCAEGTCAKFHGKGSYVRGNFMSCSRCNHTDHYIVSRETLRHRLETELQSNGTRVVRASFDDFFLSYEGDNVTVKAGVTTALKTASQIVVFCSDDLRWLSCMKFPVSMRVEASGGRSAYFFARAIDSRNLLDSGEAKFNGCKYSWVKQSNSGFAVKIHEDGSGCHSLQTIKENLRACGLNLEAEYNSKRHDVPSLIAQLTRLTLWTSLKKWIIFYIEAWFRVAVSIYVFARARFLTWYGFFFHMEIVLLTFAKRVQYRGFWGTMRSMMAKLVPFLSHAERRVRKATGSRFVSLSIALGLLQMVGHGVLKHMLVRFQQMMAPTPIHLIWKTEYMTFRVEAPQELHDKIRFVSKVQDSGHISEEFMALKDCGK